MHTPLSIVLIEGHIGVRHALAQRLQQLPEVGPVEAGGDLAAAIELVWRRSPDLVLYDPRTVGGAAVAAVRLLSESGCAVVILTSSLREDEAAMLREVGAIAVLLKAEGTTDLLAALEVARAHARRRLGSNNGAQ
jgi:DNA-binding NarL/FixJ family response regulator